MSSPCSDCLQRDSVSFPCVRQQQRSTRLSLGIPWRGCRKCGSPRNTQSNWDRERAGTILRVQAPCYGHGAIPATMAGREELCAVTELATVLVKFTCFPLFFNCSTFSTCSINAIFLFYSVTVATFVLQWSTENTQPVSLKSLKPNCACISSYWPLTLVCLHMVLGQRNRLCLYRTNGSETMSINFIYVEVFSLAYFANLNLWQLANVFFSLLVLHNGESAKCLAII